MKQKINNNLSNILIAIDLILLFSLYPIVVPKYLTERDFLIIWFLFVAISGVFIKIILQYVQNKKNKS